MVYRLVLGCGSVGRRIVERAPGYGDTLVVTDDPQVVESLREISIPAQARDPTDTDALSDVERPGVVFVAGDRGDRNRLALENAVAAFPDATTVAYAGDDPTSETRDAIAATADRVVDTATTTAEAITDRTSSSRAERAISLCRRLRAVEGTLAVVAHDNPDPDAIASAVALVELAAAIGVDAEALYGGAISHQENRALVNVLDLELRHLDSVAATEDYGGFALVDHSRPGINDGLPEDLSIDVVVDHHPPRGPVPGAFVDLRDEIGATSTLLTEYFETLELAPSTEIATALLYGIRSDTNEFVRGHSAADFRAAATLWPHVDERALQRIESPTIRSDTVETIARAIKDRTIERSVAVASAGQIDDRDALPQAAEQLLAMEGVETTLVIGFRDETVFLSARSRAPEVDLGGVLRDAFDQIGSAGGHANMAGAQLEVGILAGTEDESEIESILSVVEEVITNRFFEAIRSQPGTPVGAYRGTSDRLFVGED